MEPLYSTKWAHKTSYNKPGPTIPLIGVKKNKNSYPFIRRGYNSIYNYIVGAHLVLTFKRKGRVFFPSSLPVGFPLRAGLGALNCLGVYAGISLGGELMDYNPYC